MTAKAILLVLLLAPVLGLLLTRWVQPRQAPRAPHPRRSTCAHAAEVEVRSCVTGGLLALLCTDCDHQTYWLAWVEFGRVETEESRRGAEQAYRDQMAGQGLAWALRPSPAPPRLEDQKKVYPDAVAALYSSLAGEEAYAADLARALEESVGIPKRLDPVFFNRSPSR